MKVNWLVVLAALTLASAASADEDRVPQATTPHATVVGSSEIEAAVQRNGTGALADAVLRVVSVASKYNVGVAVVRRSQVNGRTPPDAVLHDDVTEVYQIIEGKGVLVTGGVLRSAKPMTDTVVLGEIGPSSGGRAIVGGTRHRVGPGDIVIIPAGTPHGFIEVTTPRIVYTIIRIDPLRVLALRGKTH
ncbi:MAG: AraC family ligand binding domain-containing protein [Steroidobacteraceae bacterium]